MLLFPYGWDSLRIFSASLPPVSFFVAGISVSWILTFAEAGCVNQTLILCRVALGGYHFSLTNRLIVASVVAKVAFVNFGNFARVFRLTFASRLTCQISYYES